MHVAVVGLGNMGAAIARRLLTLGHGVTVWNRSPEPAAALGSEGAEVAATPGDVWATSSVVVSMLANDAAVESVIAGLLLGSAAPQRCIIEMSTISPGASERIAAAAADAGVAYVRAPVSGNPGVVTAGNLTVMASGPADAIALAQPALDAIAARTVVVGSAEEARVAKLAANLVVAGTNELLAEAIVFAEAQGLSRETLLELLKVSAVGSPFVGYKSATLITRDYSPTFALDLLLKDLALLQDAAGAAGVTLPATAAVQGVARAAADAGYGSRDLSAVLPQLQTASGVDADEPPPPGA
jgi:3-hydroxyisobutyrate dehydrogenase-like beta-hydroxyacid dehydrogenase